MKPQREQRVGLGWGGGQKENIYHSLVLLRLKLQVQMVSSFHKRLFNFTSYLLIYHIQWIPIFLIQYFYFLVSSLIYYLVTFAITPEFNGSLYNVYHFYQTLLNPKFNFNKLLNYNLTHKLKLFKSLGFYRLKLSRVL